MKDATTASVIQVSAHLVEERDKVGALFVTRLPLLRRLAVQDQRVEILQGIYEALPRVIPLIMRRGRPLVLATP
jgi:hypothetical protein